MSETYPTIESWVISPHARSITLTTLVELGQGVRESGALWLGPRTEISRVTTIVFPCGKGVEASAGSWRVSPEVFGTVTRWAKARDLCLLGVVHTHLRGIPARLSRADREYSVQVPGVLAVVIGDGGLERNYRNWGWYLYEKYGYRRLSDSDLAQRFSMNLKDEENLCIRLADANEISEMTCHDGRSPIQ